MTPRLDCRRFSRVLFWGLRRRPQTPPPEAWPLDSIKRPIQRRFGRTNQFPGVTQLGCRNGEASWAECSGVPFGRGGVLGQASLSAYGVSQLAEKSGAGPGCHFSATERAHKVTNGGANLYEVGKFSHSADEVMLSNSIRDPANLNRVSDTLVTA